MQITIQFAVAADFYKLINFPIINVDDNSDDLHGAGGLRFGTQYEDVGEGYYNYVPLVRGNL